MNTNEANQSSKPHILVVDDLWDILDIVGPGLESHGYTVSCTDNPLDAIAIVDHQPITMLLSDVMMPQMLGNELAKRVLDKHPHIKVLLMTGLAEVTDYPVMRKPFRMHELIARLQALLDEQH